MQKFRLIQWCEKATSLIRFHPDKMVVYQELYDHLDERRDALMERGLEEKEATGKALEAMGDAEALAPELAAAHPPFWGYALRVSKILLVVLLVLSLKPLWDYATDLNFYDKPNAHRPFDVYDSASYGGDTGRTLQHLSQPGVSSSSDGSTFTVTDAAVFTEYSDVLGRDRTYLYVLIRQTSLLPAKEYAEYFQNSYSAITGWFCARDSLGNVYEGYHFQPDAVEKFMVSDSVQSGLFTCTHECRIPDFPADAEWVEIYYRREGRDLTLHIDLTGGAGK